MIKIIHITTKVIIQNVQEWLISINMYNLAKMVVWVTFLLMYLISYTAKSIWEVGYQYFVEVVGNDP
jgi:hypothetical protein